MQVELEDNEQIHNNNNNANNNSRLAGILIRGGVVAFSLVGIILNMIYAFVMPSTDVECITDYTFLSFSKVNAFFRNDQFSRDMLLIISSLCADLVILALGIIWVFYGKTWRVFATLMTFYISKLLIQIVFQEKIPDGYAWEYPGFPSIIISYIKTTDFFFSAPIGFLTIASLEFLKIKNYYLLSLALATLILQILTRIILRGNYIIDIVAAIVLAHYLFMLFDENKDYLDKLFSLKEDNNNSTTLYDDEKENLMK